MYSKIRSRQQRYILRLTQLYDSSPPLRRMHVFPPFCKKACSQCGRERIPSWLRGTNGCIIFPGAVVRCSREAVMYIPNPAPIEPANIAGSPTCFLEPSASRSPSPNKSPRSLSSPRSPVTSQAVTSAPSPNGGFVSNRQSRVTSTGLSDKQITLGTNPSRSRRGVAQAQSSPVHHGNSRGRANLVQVQGGPSFTSTRARTTLSSRSGGRSPLATHTGAARGRGKQIPHELSSRAMKAIFDAQPGETRTVMVVAVFGVRPAAPHHARSLEGYCVIVSDIFEVS